MGWGDVWTDYMDSAKRKEEMGMFVNRDSTVLHGILGLLIIQRSLNPPKVYKNRSKVG